MIRYEEVPEKVVLLARDIIEQYFSELLNVKIKYLFDTKKRMSNGKLCIGRCQKPNDLIKHFTINESCDEDGYQYVIILDKVCYENISPEDRIRLIRHELRHTLVDLDAKQPFKIYPHNIEDFVEEVELNVDNPDWARRCVSLTEEIYSQREDQEEE